MTTSLQPAAVRRAQPSGETVARVRLAGPCRACRPWVCVGHRRDPAALQDHDPPAPLDLHESVGPNSDLGEGYRLVSSTMQRTLLSTSRD